MTDPTFAHVTPDTLALFTDRYELTMMQGYVETAHEPTATFSLSFRELPTDRGYLLAAGLEQVVAYLDDLSFSERAIAHLEAEGFGPEFVDALADFEFTGDVRAVPEGTPVVPDEPLVSESLPRLGAIRTLVTPEVTLRRHACFTDPPESTVVGAAAVVDRNVIRSRGRSVRENVPTRSRVGPENPKA